MRNPTVLICLIWCCFTISQCAKVLVIFPIPTRSHHQLGESLSRILVQHGLEVTMITPFATKNPLKNFDEVIISGILEKFLERMNSRNWTFYNLENMSALFEPFMANLAGTVTTEYVMSHPNMKNLLKSNVKFDVVIIEQSYIDGLKMLALHFRAPLIVFSTIVSNVRISTFNGVPEPPSYLPDYVLRYGSDMTFMQRMNSFLMRIYQTLMLHFLAYRNQNELMQKYLPNSANLDKILYNASLVLVNSHESFDHPKPYVPNMINVGGYHISPSKELPEDLKNFMDNAEEGVIYFSMGSSLVPSLMPTKIQSAILKVLGSRKEKVLWKWDQEQLENMPVNMMISKWFPQQDILAHPNMKLFITHCGLSSITETIYHGVPILGFPVFSDQKLNADRATVLGFGKSLTFSKITEEDLNLTVTELLDNSKYRENAKYRSKVFHDRPIKPTDLAAYWVKYVIRHKGAPHLRVAGIDLPWYQYLMLDVVAVLIGIVFFVLLILIRLVKFCFRKNKLKQKLKEK